jgi:hypothetical protein
VTRSSVPADPNPPIQNHFRPTLKFIASPFIYQFKINLPQAVLPVSKIGYAWINRRSDLIGALNFSPFVSKLSIF